MHNREYKENGGLFIVRANHVEPLAPTNVKPRTDPSQMNPALKAMDADAGANASGPRRGGRDIYAGKTVAIVRGPYKTYRGIIKETTGGMARVELHTMSKIITVPLDHMVEKNPVTGESRRLVGPGPAMQNPYAAPMSGGMTPAYAGALSGGKTPAYNPYDGGRTPAYGAMATPNPYGGRTPAYGAMATPNPYAAATPNPYAAGTTPNPYAAGTTPNPYGGRTPAYGGMAAAFTPNPYASTTPNPYTSATPNPYSSTTPNPYSSTTPNPYASTTPNPYASTTPNPYASTTPNPYAAATPNPWAPQPTPMAPLLPGIRVRIVRDSSGMQYQRGAYDGALGKLTSHNPAGGNVELESGAQLADVPTSCIEALRPSAAGDACIVINGAWRGSHVTIETFDPSRCQVRMSDGHLYPLPASMLALAA